VSAADDTFAAIVGGAWLLFVVSALLSRAVDNVQHHDHDRDAAERLDTERENNA
jgi:6,7-dimethyl-8-ribityllumazine synthase